MLSGEQFNIKKSKNTKQNPKNTQHLDVFTNSIKQYISKHYALRRDHNPG